MTTAPEVRRLFNVTQESRWAFNGWFGRRDEVVALVMAHECAAVERVTAEEVEAACRSAPAPRSPGVPGWRPRFPFTLVAHHAVESLGRLPTWPEFREFCAADERARAMLWTPAREVAASAGRAAVRDRVVREFRAFLRDAHVLAVLRGHGLDVRAHPLADLVFGVDAWVDRLLLAPRGGPRRSDALLAHAMPPFFFVDLGLGSSGTGSSRSGSSGTGLHARPALDRAARRLREVLHPV
ncbi:hypothetical protein [Saccharothrix yanglingensis]|uniref:Uncharacterized protein n=1 Tax=Saccharothrix yanglingensis TaxID=659496 RepID=A0ABU0X5M6_9PSEU|nr:hypothetical protein [Saccharothrix yanglingensis]MDQ2587425.1 hypothetical protein [Saccharothrix yanglingensis]